MSDHGENVREFYRRQGEQRNIQELITHLSQNPWVTVDYLQYFLTSKLTNQTPTEKE
jgi:hypothetical protein